MPKTYDMWQELKLWLECNSGVMVRLNRVLEKMDELESEYE